MMRKMKNIVFEELPEAVRECAAYLEGYKLGLEKVKLKSKIKGDNYECKIR